MARRGELVSIKNIFTAFSTRFTPPQATVETATMAVVEKICGFVVPSEQCTYHPPTRTVSFTVPAIKKQQIKRFESEILSELKTILGAKNTPTHLR